MGSVFVVMLLFGYSRKLTGRECKFWGFFSFFTEFKESELALVVRKVGICSVGKENQNLPV